MIKEILCTIMATVPDGEGFIQIPLTEGQQVEILKIKLNEVIRHVNNLEEKLLSPEDSKDLYRKIV